MMKLTVDCDGDGPLMMTMVTRPEKVDWEAQWSQAMMSKWDIIRASVDTVIGCAGLTVWYVTVWLSIPVLYQCPSKQRNLSLLRHGLQPGTSPGRKNMPIVSEWYLIVIILPSQSWLQTQIYIEITSISISTVFYINILTRIKK